jgi:tetratricopeptide (TPR) repeat protein
MRLQRLLLIAPLAMIGTIAMALDLDSLWDFGNPALSEQRFAQALSTAQGDDALILQTQIARSHGLRGDFARAREILSAIEPKLIRSGAEVRVRYALEWGRTFASAVHPDSSQTPKAKAQARVAYLQAFELAQAEQLDALAIDALHMLAFVDTLPSDQLKWGREALALSTASSQPSAKKWEASLRNNIGMALHDLGRYDEALAEFQQAVSLRERGTDAEATRVAHWMVAWTLRALKRPDEALAIQLRLEKECAAAGTPDRYVLEELETLYRVRGDAVRAQHYAALKKALPR